MQLLPRSRTARILLSLVLFACLAVAVDLAWTWHWKQIIVSHDTTRITAPLNPQGYPDYLAALNTQLSQGITPPKNENNAAPLLLQIVGTTQTNLTWQTATHKLLNLPPDPLPPQMITLYQFRQEPRDHDAQMAVIHDMENARNAPWSREANLELAQWIDRNTHALDLLHTAVTRPRYYLPLLNRDGQPAHIGEQFFINLATPRLAAYKELADICTARAMSRLDAGDFDGFHHDLLITARLARLLTQSATLIEYLVALAIDARTFMTAQTAAISGKFNATQITTLLRDLDQLPPFPSPAAQIDTADRYIWLDFICKFAHYGGDDTPEVEFSRKFVPVNFNALLRITNTHYDALMNTIALPTFTQRQLAFEQLSQNAARIYNQSSKFSQNILSRVFYDLHKTDILRTRSLATRNLALTALALRSYKLQNGQYPDALTALPTAAYLQDPFVDAPLAYCRQAEGYLLYSLDENQQDDNGLPKSPTNPIDFDLPLQAAQ